MSASSFRELPAPPSLRDRVWSLWAQQAVHETVRQQRVVPDGGLRLVCRIGAPAEIWGPHTGATTYVLEPGAVVVGIRLHPWAARSLDGLPAAELRDRRVPAEEVLGRWAARLGDRLSQTHSARAALAALTAAAQRRMRDAAPLDRPVTTAVSRMLMAPAAPVAASVNATGVSGRHLRRRFEHEVGLSPKELQRQLRFQVVLAEVQGGLAGVSGPHLADVAHGAGFVDQAHLTHECVRLTGVPPRRFVAETRERCAEGHDHGAAFAPLRDLRT